MDGISISGILFMLLGVYELINGIATLATRKIFGFGNKLKEYTDESIRANAPLLGLGNIVLGISWIAAHLGELVPSLAFMNDYSLWILIGGVVIAVVIISIATSKLEKKEQK